MLYEISREIEAELQARGCGYPVVYGPERVPTSLVNCRIVVQRDRGTNENVSAPKFRAPNPRMIAVRATAGKCRIFAKSSLPGANAWDHEREADHVADAFTVALHVAVRKRNTEYRISGGKLLTAQELEYLSISAWPGAVYDLDFEVDRAVNDATWAGEKRPEVQVGGQDGVVITTGATVSGNAADSNLPSVQTRIA